MPTGSGGAVATEDRLAEPVQQPEQGGERGGSAALAHAGSAVVFGLLVMAVSAALIQRSRASRLAGVIEGRRRPSL
ncbi:hypothetical protein [Microtetraspora malaysiensis]|uniref:hypothetical protein n=1 Tax=Microtetraspora malaysiensis TaxID=161358 RepID=UPI003D8DCEE6